MLVYFPTLESKVTRGHRKFGFSSVVESTTFTVFIDRIRIQFHNQNFWIFCYPGQETSWTNWSSIHRFIDGTTCTTLCCFFGCLVFTCGKSGSKPSDHAFRPRSWKVLKMNWRTLCFPCGLVTWCRFSLKCLRKAFNDSLRSLASAWLIAGNWIKHIQIGKNKC